MGDKSNHQCKYYHKNKENKNGYKHTFGAHLYGATDPLTALRTSQSSIGIKPAEYPYRNP
jgi:hypothetical protein